MKETPLSNCERRFLLRAIEEKKRLDGRQTYDYRNIKISFGTDYGCCIVELGKTRVLGQVSCELVSPKLNRATEGILFFNLELSQMAAPAFEPGRQSDLLVKLNRLLERCLRNSKCIDTESLCVVAGEKVWQIRVDLHLLNHDGNIIDAASIAAIVALCHFRRPDVSVQGDEVTLYTLEERDPVPLSIHHMPICVSFAFFQQGTYLLVDPSEREERVMDGLLVIAMNKHREICTIQSSGGIMLLKDQVLRCSKIAGVKVVEITELIQKALENDQKVRKEGGKFGFAESMANQRITAFKMEKAPIDTSDVEEKAEEIISEAEPPSEVVSKPVLWTPGTAQIGEGIENSWGHLEDSEKEDEDEGGSDEAIILDGMKMDTGVEVSNIGSQDAPIVLSDSEEEEMIILEPDKNPKKIRTQTISATQVKAPSKKPVKKRKKKRAAN
ncbi:exosome complex component RRP45 isoform X1 [Bos indicus]|uniref:Exosome complex component RRP45 n=4 Tax=Bovinae TaxID=27592 RepID=F1MB54_BOVIN|nr:exosome complex component RRP45 isoform X1 [Bubalus bubalis]XP_010856632.1 PREDICTED: exosome complex component RRP45 isoform X1 [Bison bison bison]XP_019817751.1 PREDICTED: exosome complex component RRP45 isoform X1 [Bos indicus]XP_027399496.1 exosome complex component RRP45 isoform X1 [Bos indicus x Bos taurus]XP_055443553.1 exosome complex component RRP45 isoform X1 [Bubalus carabanensis]XP_061275248.1 exosome complex component RRP45 isoform X1 [Bos javanicus]DAA28955.1 TPA: exosome com